MSDVILFTDVNGSYGFGRYAGPYRIATELRQLGQSVQTIDFCMQFSIDEIIELLKMYMTNYTKIVGISSTFLVTKNTVVDNNRNNTSEISNQSTSIGWTPEQFKIISACIKKINPDCIIIVGGGSSWKKDFDEVDIWVDGEGESFIRKYFNNHSEFDFNTSTIDWHSSDHILPGEHLPIEIARGCIFKCSFCSYNLIGKKQWDYVKRPEIVKNEMLRNYEIYGTTGYMFSDDTYNDTVEKVEAYHSMLTSLPFTPDFSAYMRLDLIASKPHTIDLLYESGCRSVFFGIETFNHTAGKHIGKGMDPQKQKDILYRIKEKWPDAIISAGFIAGLPYETEESLQSTLDWLTQEDCPIDAPSLQVLSLGPTSKITNDPFSYGITRTDDGWISEWTTSKRMKDVVKSFTVPVINNFTFYNRLKNLGMNKQKLTHNDMAIVDNNYQSLFNTYKDLLWNT